MVPAEEAERIQRVLGGDRDAFEALYATCLPLVWRRATQLCEGRGAAEKLTRSVLAYAFRHLADMPADRPLAAWLESLARERAPRRTTPASAPTARHADA